MHTDEPAVTLSPALTLELRGGVGALDIGALHVPTEESATYRTQARSRPFEIATQRGSMRVDFDGEHVRMRPEGGPFGLLTAFSDDVRITLSREHTWDISIGGVAASVRADLRGVPVARFDVLGGAGSVDLIFGETPHPCHVALRGGTQRLSIVRPAGVPIRLSGKGGIRKLRVDTLSLGDVGGSFEWMTPGIDLDRPHLDVEILGGMEHLEIDTDPGPVAAMRA